MSEETCKTCPWCSERTRINHGSWVNSPVCRKNPPPFEPVNQESDWCGEHPERRRP